LAKVLGLRIPPVLPVYRGMANDVVLTDTNFYAVVPGQTVTLTVIVGDGQAGGTALLLNGVAHPFNPPGPEPIPGAVAGSFLHAHTTVQDINEMTNHTSVTYILRGGVNDEAFPYAIDVAADKGAARYLIAFIFTEPTA
jgi:hypothetical protein